MFRSLLAVLLAAASAGPALGQTQGMEGWSLARMSNGCMVQAVSPQGTMLSIWGFAGQGELGFLFQNRQWNALRDGERYRLSLDFVGVRSLPVDATAREHIDSDGPGFFFMVEPGRDSGETFLEAFATAQDVEIRQDGQKVDSLALAGGRGAMKALAQCLAERWVGPVPAEAAQEEDAPEAGAAI